MGLVESWGTGIRRIKEAAKDYGLPMPEFQVFENMFRVNFFRYPLLVQDLEAMRERLMQYQRKISEASEKHQYSIGEPSEKYQRSIGEASENHRRSIGETSEKHQCVKKTELSDTQHKILEFLSNDPQLSAAKLAEQIGIASRNVESNIKKLKEQGIIIRRGSPKSGYWEITIPSMSGNWSRH